MRCAPAAIARWWKACSICPLSPELRALLVENDLENEDDPDRLWLAREIRSGGRSTARVNGRSVPSSLLREIGDLLIDIHGQSEHLSLLRPREHVNLLDRYAGTWEQRQACASLVAQLREVRRELSELLKSEAELARRADMLKFQIEEIRSAKLKSGEDDELDDRAETLGECRDTGRAGRRCLYRALRRRRRNTGGSRRAGEGPESAGGLGEDRSEVCRARQHHRFGDGPDRRSGARGAALPRSDRVFAQTLERRRRSTRSDQAPQAQVWRDHP